MNKGEKMKNSTVKYDEIKKLGMSAKGRMELIRHLDGKKMPASRAILAKCYDCMGYFADGKSDCEMPDCSLYPWMAYREGRK
jgi:hypothetical protein